MIYSKAGLYSKAESFFFNMVKMVYEINVIARGRVTPRGAKNSSKDDAKVTFHGCTVAITFFFLYFRRCTQIKVLVEAVLLLYCST